MPKIPRTPHEDSPETADRNTLILDGNASDDRMTFVMPSPEPAPEPKAAEPEASADVDELFAEFERAAAEEVQIPSQPQIDRTIVVEDTLSEQNPLEGGKRTDIVERPVYKD